MYYCLSGGQRWLQGGRRAVVAGWQWALGWVQRALGFLRVPLEWLSWEQCVSCRFVSAASGDQAVPRARPSCARCGAFSLAVNLVWLLCSEEPFLTFMANKEILFLVRTDRAGVHKVESHGKGTNSAGWGTAGPGAAPLPPPGGALQQRPHSEVTPTPPLSPPRGPPWRGRKRRAPPVGCHDGRDRRPAPPLPPPPWVTSQRAYERRLPPPDPLFAQRAAGGAGSSAPSSLFLFRRQRRRGAGGRPVGTMRAARGRPCNGARWCWGCCCWGWGCTRCWRCSPRWRPASACASASRSPSRRVPPPSALPAPRGRCPAGAPRIGVRCGAAAARRGAMSTRRATAPRSPRSCGPGCATPPAVCSPSATTATCSTPSPATSSTPCTAAAAGPTATTREWGVGRRAGLWERPFGGGGGARPLPVGSASAAPKRRLRVPGAPQGRSAPPCAAHAHTCRGLSCRPTRTSRGTTWGRLLSSWNASPDFPIASAPWRSAGRRAWRSALVLQFESEHQRCLRELLADADRCTGYPSGELPTYFSFIPTFVSGQNTHRPTGNR